MNFSKDSSNHNHSPEAKKTYDLQMSNMGVLEGANSNILSSVRDGNA